MADRNIIGINGSLIGKHSTRDQDTISVTLDGDSFNRLEPPEVLVEKPVIDLRGTGRIKRMQFDLGMLSTHIAMIGGIGTGKSNTFNHLIEQTLNNLGDNDVAVIFDTKGDFLLDFGNKVENKIVISNDERATGYWNIFSEIEDDDIIGSAREIATAIFKDKIEKSSNPFFPTAASDIFYAYLKIMKETFESTYSEEPTNGRMMEYLKNCNPKRMFEDVTSDFDIGTSIGSYISDPQSGQTQGVIAELFATLNKVFVGNFCRNGDISLSRIVRDRFKDGCGKRVIFIEYDIKKGETLTPIYSLMVDQVLKEALSNTTNRKGSVYLFVDEFKLLPNLMHIDDAVNFGRSLGVKVVIALQAITQMYDSYGENRAKSILSGFLNYFFFNVNNKESREFVRDTFGECVRQIRYSQQTSIGEHVFTDKVVKDKNITRLKRGEAIVGLHGLEPFIFKFERWIPFEER